MARVRTVGIIPSHFHPRYRSAPGEIAARMFPDLATPNDLAIADWRRQAFNSDLVWADRVVRGDADVPEDELPVQPRRQTTDEQRTAGTGFKHAPAKAQRAQVERCSIEGKRSTAAFLFNARAPSVA